MSVEEQFFHSLRAVSIHMIKHAEDMDAACAAVLKLYEDDQWEDLPIEEQIAKLEELAPHLAEDSALGRYFSQYPHKWSKERFHTLLTHLDAYLRELRSLR